VHGAIAFLYSMSKFLQWLLGFSVVVLVLAFVFTLVAPYLWPNSLAGGMPMLPGAGMAGHMRGGMMGGGMMNGGLGMWPAIRHGLGWLALGVPLLTGLFGYWLGQRTARPAAPPPPAA
jgi:hypothetical protein